MSESYVGPGTAVVTKRFKKLVSLLRELFQLDQPDLDFGIYRILHARSAEIAQFLEHDLLPQVQEAFAQYKPADKAALEKELAEAIAQAQKLGADPETLPKVQELRARLAEDAVDLSALEAEVYDHLYTFFRRYYHEGDFISRRVYKEGVYAIPYEGEEVKLYWANHDQYYVKTSEYLRDYAFRLRPQDEQSPMRVRFQLVDAAEGEHGNVKESNKRVFVLASENWIGEEDGELVIRFEFRPATLEDWPEEVRDGKKRPPTQKDLNAHAEETILSMEDPSLAKWTQALGSKYVRTDGSLSENTTLRVHLDRYAARNTFDYFIHKDLGGFLRRELDFYIKNEVMFLDDIESETAPRVEQYLSKIKVIRKIAHKIVDFLAQLEDFQKKLWEKKKFVTETFYCITVGNIPEAFYPEIAENEAQWDEWKQLFHIDENTSDLFSVGKSKKDRRIALLKNHPTLVLDTRLFDRDFVDRLLASFDDLDDMTDGLLVHSENWQALNLLLEKHRERVKTIYIDPPYNTGNDEFLYRDNYQHSSWLSMMHDRLTLGREWMQEDGVIFVSIDDVEQSRLKILLDSVFSQNNFAASIAWWKRHGRNNNAKICSDVKDFLMWYRKTDRLSHAREPRTELSNASYSNPDNDPRGPWTSISYVNPASKEERPNLVYGIKNPFTGEEVWHPTNAWKYSKEEHERHVREHRLYWGLRGENKYPRLKVFLSEVGGLVPKDVWTQSEAGTTDSGSKQIANLFGKKLFNNPKPSKLIENIGRLMLNGEVDQDATFLDFFAGSGTTGHAVINLNREDGGRRKFILVEQADYFDTVLLPRLMKITFTPEWKEGKPKRLATAEEAQRSPRIFKVIRLESYEDTLNNLELKRTREQQSLLDVAEAQGPDRLREQYMLRYMLEVEARGSRSLLNIAAFTDPTAYALKVKRPGSDESREANVDLIETFNWLIGLTVEHMAAPQTFEAEFERDGEGRLRLKGRLRPQDGGPWWFRTVTGTTRDGRKALVIWRKRPGGEEPEGIERDNLVLNEWFTKQGYSIKDNEFDLVYVNGDNNLENLKAPDDTWKVRLIEEDFLRLMFEMEGM